MAAINDIPEDKIGIAALPTQLIVAKRGTAFTLMVAGESGLGKTTFINTLFATDVKKARSHRVNKDQDTTVEIEVKKAELTEKNFTVRLTVIDTPGFGDFVNNTDAWKPIVEFIDDQHESYMLQDQQPERSRKVDLRVHACVYFIRPTGHSLKPLDIQVMKHLHTRVNLIPVIAKADTLSSNDLAFFKNRISAVIKAQGIKIYMPNEEEVPDSSRGDGHPSLTQELINAMPFSVIGSTGWVKNSSGNIVRGRLYPWGVAEVEDESHCDFKKLRSVLIRSRMLNLIQTTEDIHYEAYRAAQMDVRKVGEARPRVLDHPKFKEDEERLRKRFTEMVRVEEDRFRQWEQRLLDERARLNADLAEHHNRLRQLEAEHGLSKSAAGRGR